MTFNKFYIIGFTMGIDELHLNHNNIPLQGTDEPHHNPNDWN